MVPTSGNPDWGSVFVTRFAPVLFRGIIGGQRFSVRMFSRITRRITRALFTVPTLGGWLDTATLTLLFGCLALVIGFGAELIEIPLPEEISREALAPQAIAAGFMPENEREFGAIAGFILLALAAELGFRAALIPRREERLPLWRKWSWAALALGAFVASYPLGAHFFGAQSVLSEPSFLVLVALLGLSCTLLYRRTGSVWSAMTLHGLAVVSWQMLASS
jgi:predicted Abi (CAAX) family protease